MDLDCALVRLWESHKTCAKVILCGGADENKIAEKQDHASIGQLLPEMTKKMKGGIQLELETDESPPFLHFPTRF